MWQSESPPQASGVPEWRGDSSTGGLQEVGGHRECIALALLQLDSSKHHAPGKVGGVMNLILTDQGC